MRELTELELQEQQERLRAYADARKQWHWFRKDWSSKVKDAAYQNLSHLWFCLTTDEAKVAGMDARLKYH